MSVLFDTNVLLDIALKREPFMRNSALALAKARKTGSTQLCATSVTTLHYFLSKNKSLGELGARQFLQQCLQTMPVAHVDQTVLQQALSSPMHDFEDGVIAQAAHTSGVHTIVTRNKDDFARSPVPALTPDEYLSLP